MTSTPPVEHFTGAFALDATPDRVFEALTNPAALAVWCASEAHVEPRVGGAHRLAGEGCAPTAGEGCAPTAGDGRVTHFEPPRLFGYTYQTRDVRHAVTLRITPVGDHSELHVTHDAPGTRQHYGDDCPAFFADYWTLQIANLNSYLRRGAPAVRPTFRDDPVVQLDIEVAAPPERVWQALTDPAPMNQWLAKAAEVEPCVGGAYTLGWTSGRDLTERTAGPSRIVEIDPPRLLVHDWSYVGEPASQVRWELTPTAAGTRVRLIHRPIQPGAVRDGYVQGWAAFLVRLHNYLTPVIVKAVAAHANT